MEKDHEFIWWFTHHQATTVIRTASIAYILKVKRPTTDDTDLTDKREGISYVRPSFVPIREIRGLPYFPLVCCVATEARFSV